MPLRGLPHCCMLGVSSGRFWRGEQVARLEYEAKEDAARRDEANKTYFDRLRKVLEAKVRPEVPTLNLGDGGTGGADDAAGIAEVRSFLP